MKNNPNFTERWVQQIIENDPSLLELGKIECIGREKIHRKAGRLDLLFQDVEDSCRYVLELQLGATDESHIIRCLEYWDIESKRHRDFEHYPVIVAEEITSRFFNVIALFNRAIPIIAIQMQLMQVGQQTSLVFTTILDGYSEGPLDDADDVQGPPTDRSYWDNRASKTTVSLADELLPFLRKLDPSLEFNFTKYYIGLLKNGQPFNFVMLRPKKDHLKVHFQMPKSEEMDVKFQSADLDSWKYDRRRRAYYLKLNNSDEISKQQSLIEEMMQSAYDNRTKAV